MKTNQSKFKNLLVLLLIGFFLASCSSDDDGVNPDDPDNNILPITLDCDAFKDNNPDGIPLLENRSDGVDYIIDCVIPVEIDLAIDPGVVIQFTDASGMKIEEGGSVNAIGSQSDPIIFTSTSEEKGAWKGILSYSQSVQNRFDYVTIEYAGGGSFNSNGDLGSLILWADAAFKLNNVTINHGKNNGINASYQHYNVEINNSTITNCETPIYGDANIASHISGGDFTGNTNDAIRLISDAGSRRIKTSQTWKNLSVPYRIAENLVINDGAKFTIDPGVVIEFEDAKGLMLDKMFDDGSALIAEGTPTEPIVFTGVTKLPGAWETISIRRTSSVQNKIDNVLIEYAGGAGAGGALEMRVDPVLSVTNTTFKDVDGCAIYNLSGSTNPNLTESDNDMENVSGDYLCGE